MYKVATLQLTRALQPPWVDRSAPPTQRRQNLGDSPPLLAILSHLAKHFAHPQQRPHIAFPLQIRHLGILGWPNVCANPAQKPKKRGPITQNIRVNAHYTSEPGAWRTRHADTPRYFGDFQTPHSQMAFDEKTIAAAMQRWQMESGPGLGMTFTRLRRSLGTERPVALEANWAEAGLTRELTEFKVAVQGSMPNSAHREAQAATDFEIIDLVCRRISHQQDLAAAAASVCALYERIANDVVADSALVGRAVVTAASARFRAEFLLDKCSAEAAPRE